MITNVGFRNVGLVESAGSHDAAVDKGTTSLGLDQENALVVWHAGAVPLNDIAGDLENELVRGTALM